MGLYYCYIYHREKFGLTPIVEQIVENKLR